MTRVQFTGTFIYCDEVTIGGNDHLVTLQCTPNQHAYINDAIFAAMNTDVTLAIDLDA